MPSNLNEALFTFLGTIEDDLVVDGFENTDGNQVSEDTDAIQSANGKEGDDEIRTSRGNDLAAGDMVGNEWTLVNGEWIYESAALVVSDYGSSFSFDDIIATGDGNDVLLGNGGNDTLFSGAGEDRINAGTGNDIAFGGSGDDFINLEGGDDFAEAGQGDDIVNGGDGDDIIYGDLMQANLLVGSAKNATSFSQLAASGGWSIVDADGEATISQSANTVAGETYTVSFQLAANLAAQYSSATVEVIWNGEVVETVTVSSGAYETFKVDVESTGEEGELTFRAIEENGASGYNFDGPIISYDKDVDIAGQTVSVEAFAPGQANLYQVIDGHLNVFDVEEKAYAQVGPQPNFKINAVGFNVEDDLIYGVAKSNGTDSLGNAVGTTDIVMIDAAGSTYRIGDGFYGDYVGDFDDSGNLWTFHSSLDRISVVDVDNRDADGNPQITYYKFPQNMFTDRSYDLAYSTQEDSFYAVIAPRANGNDGKVVRIDVSGVEAGGNPTFSEMPITGTLYGDQMADGMAKGAYGAVFFDGDANLYFGLNRGDHDLQADTANKGGIFKVNMDWDNGQAYAEFMSEAQSTGSNDGAVDPRSADAFGDIDADAAVLLRDPTLTVSEGGNDKLRGGEGRDLIHGNEGADDISGGLDDDRLYGDEGHDKISAGSGNDDVYGGTGDDKLRGEAGNDMISGGEGQDFLDGGSGNDMLDGGAQKDKIVGGSGRDTINGGSEDDHLWGGNWSADGSADTFVFESGSGKDYVHDFEAGLDVIDLSAFDTTLAEVQSASDDLGWATVVNLQSLEAGQDGDKIVLKSVSLEELDASSFLF